MLPNVIVYHTESGMSMFYHDFCSMYLKDKEGWTHKGHMIQPSPPSKETNYSDFTIIPRGLMIS